MTYNFAGDLLENYCPNDDLMNASRIFFSITILLTYPIECFVTREVIENTLLPNVDDTHPFSRNKHFIITFLTVCSTYLISMATDCLGIVLELNVSFVLLLPLWSLGNSRHIYIFRGYLRPFLWHTFCLGFATSNWKLPRYCRGQSYRLCYWFRLECLSPSLA